MPRLTSRRRARINKKNASRSTGPKSPEGKRASSMNAVTHGLRSETVPPTDPEVLAALEREINKWVGFYLPKTPGEFALLRQCATAQVQMIRAQTYQDGHTRSNGRKAQKSYDEARDQEVGDFKKMLRIDP